MSSKNSSAGSQPLDARHAITHATREATRPFTSALRAATNADTRAAVGTEIERLFAPHEATITAPHGAIREDLGRRPT
jgi:hypothetical protein